MPPSAASTAPSRARSAPVNAPRVWPKSSDSKRLSGTAPQSKITKGPRARGERSWRARATSSLPVPVSPRTSTVASEGATRESSAKSARIGALEPMRGPKCGSGQSWIGSGRSFTTTVPLTGPKRTWESGTRRAERTRTPSTNVPLRLSRSVTQHPFGTGSSRAWSRETPGASRTRSADSADPTVEGPRTTWRRPWIWSASWPRIGAAAGPTATVGSSPPKGFVTGRKSYTVASDDHQHGVVRAARGPAQAIFTSLPRSDAASESAHDRAPAVVERALVDHPLGGIEARECEACELGTQILGGDPHREHRRSRWITWRSRASP